MGGCFVNGAPTQKQHDLEAAFKAKSDAQRICALGVELRLAFAALSHSLSELPIYDTTTSTNRLIKQMRYLDAVRINMSLESAFPNAIDQLADILIEKINRTSKQEDE